MDRHMSTPMQYPPRTRRWTREEYYSMADAGLIPSDAHVELIEGEIITMSPRRSAHMTAVTLTGDLLRDVFGQAYTIRIQGPLSISRYSEPEPDVAVAAGSARDYAEHHPATALLIVEVSDTTLDYDRTTKASLYARADIQEYWVLNLIDRQLEVHRHPEPMDAQAFGYGYGDIRVFDASEAVAPMAAPERPVKVADLLP
jgi:Uma2 family endonuclease